MIELPRDEFKYVEKLFNENNKHYPLLKSIISQAIEGKIFVDNVPKCESAFLVNNLGWVYFLGNEKNQEFNKYVEKVLVSNYLRNPDNIIWFGISDYWEERVKEGFSKALMHFPRIQYIFRPEKYQTIQRKNSSYHIVEITEQNIEKSIEFDNSITSFWKSKEKFLEKGFGYAVLDREKVVSQSISASIEDKEVEIDIMTDMEYRGKGLAKLLSMYLIDKCIEKELRPKWDCRISNEPSKKLAEKLGFQPKKEYLAVLIKIEK